MFQVRWNVQAKVMSTCRLCAVVLFVLAQAFVCGDEAKRETIHDFLKNSLFRGQQFTDSGESLFGDQSPTPRRDWLLGRRYRRSVRRAEDWKPGKPLCSPRDSCKGRCGQPYSGLPYTCGCDYACVFYSDCCTDYEIECGSEEKVIVDVNLSRPKAQPVCTKLPTSSFHFFAINRCSAAWTNDSTDAVYFISLHAKACPGISTDDRDDCERNIEDRCWNHCVQQVKQNCENKDNIELVRDSAAYVYSNPSCAVCNWETNFMQVEDLPSVWSTTHDGHNDTDDRSFTAPPPGVLRECFPSISACSLPVRRTEDQIFKTLCEQYGGPVITDTSRKPGGKAVVYKNAYCAACSGEDMKIVHCPSGSDGQRNAVTFVRNNRILTIRPKKFHNIPAAFSLLLNFGLDGKRRVLISSDDENEIAAMQKTCGPSRIWDPFSKICRRLYCSTDYILVDFQCVKRNESDSSADDECNDTEFDWNSVHITLTVQVGLLDMLNFYGRESNFTEVFAESLAEEYSITADRIRNVKVNISLGNITDFREMKKNLFNIDESQPITFTIDFDLYESSVDVNDSQPGIDSIVHRLSSSVSSSDEGFYLDIQRMKSRIFQVQHSASMGWCSPETGGVKRRYWNSDFTFISNGENGSLEHDAVVAVHVNKTGKTYQKGQFFANILYQRFHAGKRHVNVSKMVIVCDRKSKLNESCLRVMLNRDDYSILSNGTLVLSRKTKATDHVDLGAYEYGENGSIFLCLKEFEKPDRNHNERTYLSPDTEAYVSLVLMCVSLFALAAVLITYVTFPCLRNLPGCNTMNLTLSLLAMQVTFLLGQRRGVTGPWCKLAAVLLHYEILCSFMWMNVMAYDLFKTFGCNSVLTVIRSKNKYLIKYLIYSYGSPMILIGIGVMMDAFGEGISMSPHYGDDTNSCWITKNAAVVFFAAPLGIIMTVNVIFYVMTILSIRSVKHTVTVTHVSRKGRGWTDVMLYAKMAFVTGLTWTLAFAAAYVPQCVLIGQVIRYAFIVFNTLQGVFIFFVFVFNKRVASLYAGLIKRIWRLPRSPASESAHSREAKAVNRCVSSETTISTISTSSYAK